MALLLDETPETSANEALSTTTKKRSSHRPLASSLTSRENRVVNALRFTVLILLLATTILVSVTVYLYATNNETNEFVAQFEDGAAQIATSFLDVVERNLGAINTMSTYITSYANHSGQTFPNVTIPDFEFHGSNLRIQGGTHIVHWCPLVWDETREEWEAYALQNRFHIDEAFRKDAELRSRQDADFASHFERQLEDEPQVEAWNETILQDGTGYHPKLWSNGALLPTGDIPFGYGPYLPLWQRR